MSDSDGWDRGEKDTPIAALSRAVSAHPDRIFLDFSGDTYTYGEIDGITNRFAHSLRDLGVQAGDTVVSVLDNNIDAVIAWLAINKLRAVSVPLNTALRGEFLRHQVANAGAKIVISESGYVERLNAIADGLTQVTLILHRGDLPEGDLAGSSSSSSVPLEPLADHAGDDDSALGEPPDPSDIACLIYTSGTTGPSKACMVGFNYQCNLARLKLRGAPATADDITYTPLPLFHQNAIVSGITSTMLVGGRIAFAPRFSVSQFWPDIERSGATIASILGGMGTLLAQAPDNDSMKRCYGQVHTVRGNPFNKELKDIWKARFGSRHVGSNDYGVTEAAVVTSLAEGEYATAPPDSSGRRNPDFDVRIVDDDDNELPPNQPGEVIIRPLKPNAMFDGYWRDPEATLRVFGNLWFHTGDIGTFDENGYFYFKDRKKDYLRRRGENISSFEMESTFLLHPNIEEVAVHAVLSPFGEDDVKVTAVLTEGSELGEETLCVWAIERVPYYAVPRYIEFRDALPKNSSGRILKYQLRDEGATPDTWDLEKSDIKVTRR